MTHPAIENGFYEIQLDANGLNVDLSPALVAAAEAMPVTDSTYTVTYGTPPDTRNEASTCVRCSECGCVIPFERPGEPSLVGRIADLTLNHGWRMDGHQYDNQNRRLDPEPDHG